jgi:hypothetical protein
MTGATFFIFTQVTPSTEWTITHNLGHHPIFDVVIDVDGGREKVLPLAVEHVSVNQTVVRFLEARTGSARFF